MGRWKAINMRLRAIFLLTAALCLSGLTPGGSELMSTSAQPSQEALTEIQKNLGLSAQIARVTDASLYPTNRLPEFVLIQDVHKHTEVQSKIATVILQGYQQWGAKKAFLEGAISTVDLTVFHRLPDATRNDLLAKLVFEGNMSGPEMASVLIMEREWRNPPTSPFQLVGIEEAKIYKQSLEAFHDVKVRRDSALYEIMRIRRLQESERLQDDGLLFRKQLDRTEALVRLKLSPDEYEEYQQDKRAIPSSPSLTPAVRAAERFYRLADLRSRVFIDEIIRKYPASPGPRLVVVGGFHTSSMAAYLRAASKSFVVVTPHITTASNDPLYERRMMESINTIRLATPRVKPALTPANSR